MANKIDTVMEVSCSAIRRHLCARAMPPMPALFTRMDTPPISVRTRSANSHTLPSEERSRGMNCTEAPDARYEYGLRPPHQAAPSGTPIQHGTRAAMMRARAPFLDPHPRWHQSRSRRGVAVQASGLYVWKISSVSSSRANFTRQAERSLETTRHNTSTVCGRARARHRANERGRGRALSVAASAPSNPASSLLVFSNGGERRRGAARRGAARRGAAR